MENLKFIELKSPQRRTYIFPYGDKITYNNIVKICVRPSGSHRLETKDGLKIIVAAGWRSIEIETAADWTF